VRKIGKYQIVRSLVSNRSRHLFEALDSCLGRCLVLQLPGLQQAGPAQVVPFLDGAPAVTALRHPNIARVFELGIEGGLPYIVMEPLPGIETDALVHVAAGRSAQWKIHVLTQVCEAIAHAHGEGVVHLDVRPTNVFVTPAGAVKVLGFGAAPLRGAGFENAALDAEDVLYAAPEQIAGGSVDHRAEVYSVGALAYELFSGRRPFPGGSPREVLDEVRNEAPDPALLPPTEYSPRLEAMVVRALARRADDRYRRIADMRKAMEDLSHNSVDAFFDRMLQADRAAPPARAPSGGPRNAAGPGGGGSGGRPDRVQVLYDMALGQAAEGRLEEASKLARAIRRLAPDDPRNSEMTAYLLVEAETAVKTALASSPPEPRARALRQYLESLRTQTRRAQPRPRTGWSQTQA
jgi:hypothetical protein